jgi:hypothetical protein
LQRFATTVAVNQCLFGSLGSTDKEVSMSTAPPPEATEVSVDEPWYVYDRHLNLLHTSETLADAEAWAIAHWGVVEVADREEVALHDYWYLLFAAAEKAGYTSRDFQARIVRRDRVIAIGKDPDASPRFPSTA